MKEIKNILKKFNINALTLGTAVILFFIVLSGSFIYRLLSKPEVNKNNAMPLSSIVKRLDNAIEAVKDRSPVKGEIKKRIPGIAITGKNSGKTAPGVGPLLKGVAKNRGKIKVFLNDQILCLGDVLDGYTVAEIKKDSVTLRDEDGYESNISLETE